MENKYIPKPIDTSDIILSDSIKELIELMAENVHDVWAAARISQGWTYGTVRNDNLKQHPCLVAYKDLSEIEKDYDRNTAISTLKLIIKSGYEIKKI